ncbi:hypothetical protein [Tabrizicola sp.]|uniref:hypothetical protein n=1 Tax=Tabrizicola sp. TaxID=2005166 RepID=UPI003F3EA395
MTVLDQTVLGVLLPGFTHHVDIGQGADATISYGAGGLARMILPGKPPMNGEWHPLPKGYHVAWHEGPVGNWQIAHEAGKLTYIDPTGREAGTVTRIEPIGPWPTA